ncbi:MAG: EamA/RhaT family transporter, partial [Pseudomonadota bacterium]
VFILKPAADAFNLYALLPLAAAMLYALAMILTRTKCRDEHPLVLSAVLNVTFILIGLFVTVVGNIAGDAGVFSGFMSSKWAPMDTNEFAAVGLLGIAILVASIGTAIAYQSGPSSVVATFDFSYVGFAVIWGLIFFSELPDLISLCGMLLIVIAGIISIRQ